jgi:hypothetical protein
MGQRLRQGWAELSNGFILAAVAGLGLAADPAHAGNLGFSWQVGAGGRVAVEVLDRNQGQPVSQAQVSVSEGLDGSASSWREVAEGATTQFVLPNRSGPFAIRVRADGYSTFALVGVPPAGGSLKVYLSRRQNPADAILSGRLGGWAPRSGSDRIQAGLVLKALSVFDLVQFQFDQIISPLRDTVDIMGNRQIPSNVVLPDQRVSIPLGTLRLNKPDYRLPVESSRPVSLAAVQGEMRSGEVINLFMGGGKFDFGALNILKFTKAGIIDVADPRDGARENIDASFTVSPRHTVTPRAAPFPSDIVVAAAVDTLGDRKRLLPTDLKTAGKAGEQARPVRLAGIGPELPGPRVVAGLAIGEEGKRLSGVAHIGVSDQVQLAEFRPVTRHEDFGTAPQKVGFAGLTSGLTSLVFQKRLPPDSEKKARVGEVLATVYALPTAQQGGISLSELGLSVSEVGRYAYHEFELEAGFDPSRIDEQSALDGIRRFTRSAATYRP